MTPNEMDQFTPDTDLPVDAGILRYVQILRRGGVETNESCEGGEGHPFPEPTVCFFGTLWAGFHAFSVAMENGLPVYAIRLRYAVVNGLLEQPVWEMTFSRKDSAK